MRVQYTKMQGLKNDFIVFKSPVSLTNQKVAELCNRSTGIGADGILVVGTDSVGTVTMEYWNADGSKAEMCGNGLRCVARFAVDQKLIEPGTFMVETPNGSLKAYCGKDSDEDVTVQVGKVILNDKPLVVDGFTFHEANVGNPHAVTFVDDLEQTPVATLGPMVENDPHFPNRTNVEFVRIKDKNHIELRVWERGVGETQACGTGIVASAVLSEAQHYISLPATVTVRGGSAKVWIDESGYGTLQGPVVVEYVGKVEI